jgi:DNA-binding SARP family transcriptional activator
VAEIEIRLLGPIAVARDGATLALAGPKQRVVLALLASRPGLVVSTDRLLEALWGPEPPRTAATALHGHVSRLRRLLDPDVIATRSPGYVLEVPPDAVDAARFEQLVERARREQPGQRAETLTAALALWRGAPFADVVGASTSLHEEAQRLDELRLMAQEELFEAGLVLGRHVALAPELESFLRAEPLRERVVGQLMLALYRAGRQVDALEVYRRFRRELNDTLALEPGQPLRELERRILAQDPSLAPVGGPRPEAPRRLPLTAVAIGLEPAAAELDAEAYARGTARAREAVRLVLERHGAAVERAGNAVIGLFGTPLPHEDDATRAVQASREALAAVEELAGRIDAGARMVARAGVASGEAFGGESPAIARALRLQAEAEPGWLTVDEATRARSRARELRIDRRLAGRERERRLLRERFDAAVRDRRSAVVPLLGAAGIGKSRLAEDLLGSLGPPVRVLRGRCISYGDGVGLLPAAEIARGALDVPADDLTAGAARERLVELLAESERAGPAVEQLMCLLGFDDGAVDEGAGWALRRLLEQLAAAGPLAVLVEDLHWASPDFLAIVEQLVEPSAGPIVVVATAREAPTPRFAEDAIRLAPLDPDGCAIIVRELLADRVEQASLDRLAEGSGGNPLYLEELVLDARASGRLHRDESGAWRLDGGEGSTPPSIQSLLAMRIERLPESERELLSRAAVLGKSFALAALADLAGDPGAALDELLAKGLLEPAATAGDDVEFHHLLIRDAAYAALPLELRAELHERHAAWLDRIPAAPSRPRDVFAVYHLDQAYRARETLAPGAPHLAAARSELVARTAALGRSLLARGDGVAAAGPLTRALELAPDDHVLAVELGRARLAAGDLAAAQDAFALADDGPVADRARLGRIEIRLHTDAGYDLDAAGREIAELVAAMRERDDGEGEVEALFASAYVSLARGRAGEIGPVLDEALALTRGLDRSHAEAEILFLVCGSCWYGPLPLEDGLRRCGRILAESEGRPNVQAAALQALAVLRAMRADYAEARRLVRVAESIWHDVGRAVSAAATAIDVGLVELLAGAHAEAESVLRRGYAELDRIGEKGYFSTVAALLAAAVEAQGRSAEARELARGAAAASAEGDAVSQVSWRVAEARALAALGDHDGAARIAGEATALADTTDFLLLRGDAWAAHADVAAARGDTAVEASARATAIALLEEKGVAPAAIEIWARLGRAHPAVRQSRR